MSIHDDPNRIDQLVARARALVPDELERFLTEQDDETRAELERRLDELGRSDVDDFENGLPLTVTRNIAPDTDPIDTESVKMRMQVTQSHKDDSEHPSQIGAFKILQPIGRGGMGQVYMAEQRTPVKRRVALKVIKTDTPTKEILARFEAERQALAMMDHQNIAKVLDAGITEEGRPFFAMELVKGVPITDYCDENKLTPNERLQLFVQACRAIQHAHQKGIIHRDLKPSNILVTLYDGKPVAKVIDFGLAKAVYDQTQLTDKTLFTEYGQVVGTLEYMSPEQAEFNALDVDTRTDVYSLGIILYELLTGSTPLGRERIRKLALDRILHMIREEDVPRPSVRLSNSGDAINGISMQRRMDSRRLSLLLRGELDWIAVKALEKDRTRRYEGAAALAEDVCRFLAGEAIEARPPSLSYRIRKSIRKNRGIFSAAATVLGVLLVGLASTTSLWFESSRLAAEKEVEALRAKKAEEKQTLLTTQAESARESEKKLRLVFQESSSKVQLEKGLDLANRGLISEGLGWMTRALQEAPETSKINEVIRRNIAAWLEFTPRFVGSIDLQGQVGRHLTTSEDGKIAFTMFADLVPESTNIDDANRIVIVGISETPEVLCDQVLSAPIVAMKFLRGTDSLLVALITGELLQIDSKGNRLGMTKPTQFPITTFELSSDGRVFIGDATGAVSELSRDLTTSKRLFSCNEQIAVISVSARARVFLVIASDNTVYAYDAEGMSLNRAFEPGRGYARAANADLGVVACSDLRGAQSSAVQIWNAFQGTYIDSVQLTNNANDVTFDPDSGHLVTTDKGLIVTGWDLREFLPVWQYSAPLAPIKTASNSSLCATLSVGIQGTNVRIYELPSERRQTMAIGSQVSHHGSLENGQIRVWLSQIDGTLDFQDRATRKLMGTIHLPGTMAMDSIDDRSFATSFNPNGTAVWDTSTMSVSDQAFLQQNESFQGAFGISAFRLDGRPHVILGGNLKGNRHVEFRSGSDVTLNSLGTEFYNYAIDWSPKHGLVAIGSHDGTIQLWTISGEFIAASTPPLDAEIFGLDINSDETEIVASTRIGTVYRYTFPKLELLGTRRGQFGPYSQWFYGSTDEFVAGGYFHIEARDTDTLLQIGPRFGHHNSAAHVRIFEGELNYAGNVVAGDKRGLGALRHKVIPPPIPFDGAKVAEQTENRLGQRIVGNGGVTQLLPSTSGASDDFEQWVSNAWQEQVQANRQTAVENFESWREKRHAYGDCDRALHSKGHDGTSFVAHLPVPTQPRGPVSVRHSKSYLQAEISSEDYALAWGIGKARLEGLVTSKAGDGFQLMSFSEYIRDGKTYFSAVWHRSDVESIVEIGISRQAVEERHAQLQQQGYQLAACEQAPISLTEPSIRFNAVWTQNSAEALKLSLAVSDPIWNQSENVDGSWKSSFNRAGLRIGSLTTREIGSSMRANTAIWGNGSKGPNWFTSRYLFERDRNIALDAETSANNTLPGLRRVTSHVTPTFPDGTWEMIINGQVQGGLWSMPADLESYQSALRAFFDGNFAESEKQLGALKDFRSWQEREVVVLFQVLSKLRQGKLEAAQQFIQDLGGAVAFQSTATNPTPIVKLLPVLQLVGQIPEMDNDSMNRPVGFYQSWLNRFANYLDSLESNLARVDCCVVASLAVQSDELRALLQKRAVGEMDRSSQPHQQWFNGMYGTLWGTPEFQRFARREEFDVLVSNVWHARQGKQSALAEALDFRTLAYECEQAMAAGYAPKSVSIAERTGGKGIVALALFERANPDAWLTMPPAMARVRHETSWGQKKVKNAVREWLATGDASEFSRFLIPNSVERGWAMREVATNPDVTAEMCEAAFPKSATVLIALASSPDAVKNAAAKRRARIILVDKECSSILCSAARWVGGEQEKDFPMPDEDLTDQVQLISSNALAHVTGHNDHSMVVLLGNQEFPMGAREGEMGRLPNEYPHQRRLETSKFAMSLDEVTVAQFRRFRPEHGQENDESLPVTQVSWYDAVAYCNWLSQQAGLPESEWVYQPNDAGEYGRGTSIPRDWWRRKGYRLPTEVEWEFACRAHSITARPCGDSLELIDDYCWTSRNSEDRLHPVGEKMPNYFGLFDMLGNASEWCHTSHELYLSVSGEPSVGGEMPGVVDPSKARTVRGGSAMEFHGNARSAFRDYYTPNVALPCLGFRVVRTITP